MSLVVTCGCGKKLKGQDAWAGRKVKCPACGAVLVMPTPHGTDDDPDIYDLTDADAESPAPSPATTGSPPNAHAAKPGTAAPTHSVLYDASLTRARGRDTAAQGAVPLFNAFGTDFTPAKLASTALVLLLLVGGGMWYFLWGPGVKARIAGVQPVHAVPLLEGLATREPYSLFTGTGDRSLGIKGPKLKSQDNGITRQDHVLSLGGDDQMILARHDDQGGHLLVELDIAQGVFDVQNQVADYKVQFNRQAFTMEPVDGSGPPVHPVAVLYTPLSSGTALDLAGADTSGYAGLMPAGVEPTKQELTPGIGGGAARGTVTYHGDQGVQGAFTFRSFYFMSGAAGATGVTADGSVTRTIDDRTQVQYDYQGDTLVMRWNSQRPASVWWGKSRFARHSEFTQFSRHSVVLLFERPTDHARQRVKFGNHVVGTLRPDRPRRSSLLVAATTQPAITPTAPSPVAALARGGEDDDEEEDDDDERTSASPAAPVARTPSLPVTTPASAVSSYFDNLARSRDKARGIVSASNMNQLAIGLRLYADAHQGALPERLDQLRIVLGNSFDALMLNPRTREQPGFIYERPAATFQAIADPAQTPILWEARNGQKDPAGAILYADGHLKIP